MILLLNYNDLYRWVWLLTFDFLLLISDFFFRFFRLIDWSRLFGVSFLSETEGSTFSTLPTLSPICSRRSNLYVHFVVNGTGCSKWADCSKWAGRWENVNVNVDVNVNVNGERLENISCCCSSTPFSSRPFFCILVSLGRPSPQWKQVMRNGFF